MTARRLITVSVLTGLLIVSLCGCHFHVTAHAGPGFPAHAVSSGRR